MTDIVVESMHTPAITADDIRHLIEQAGGCLETHRVRWKALMLSHDEARMLCHLQAPDAESARIAFRQTGLPVSALWPAMIHPTALSVDRANTVIEWSMDPLPFSDTTYWTSLSCQILPVSTFVCYSKERAISLVRTPDINLLEMQLFDLGLSFTRIWRFRRLRGCLQ